MNLVTRSLILLCGIYICDAGYGAPPPPMYETQSDVQAPSYAPPYAKTHYSGSKTYYRRKTSYGGTKTHGYGTKTGYGGTKTGYGGTKTGYGGTKTAYGERRTWNSDSGSAPTYEEFSSNANQPFQAKCDPECKNNGICVDTNTCHCPPNYKGRYCELESKPCLSYPPLPVNSLRKCSPEFCTITCFEGYKFAGLGTTVANMKCSVDGTWQPTIPLLASIPDCEPQCNPPCLNDGVCLSVDTCQCPAEYKGPQCQYATSVCDVRKLGFNGGYNCMGDADSFTCTLSCPTGIAFSSPPAESYTCSYAGGQFLPQPIPQCVYSENMIVIPGAVRNSSYYEYHSSGSHTSGSEFEQQNSGFEQQNSGFEQQSGFEQEIGGFEQQNSGFEQQNSGFEQQSGFGQENSGFEQQNSGFEQQSGFDTFTQKPIKIVVQDFTPKGGVCMTWAGVHYKTFDGKIYSFQSPCQHVLLRDRKEHKFTVALQQGDCKRKAYCPPEISIYLEDRLYVLSVGEDGSVLFRNTKRLIPIPASLEGIRVSMPSDYVIVNLDSNGVTIKWDTNTLIVIEGTAQLWNNTEGLCGTLNSNQADEYLMKDGSIAPTQSAFTSSWHVNKIGDVCTSNPSEINACASRSEVEVKQAQAFCSKVLRARKFQRCALHMDVSQLMDTCQWDYCVCAASLSPEDCACATVSVYAKECLRNGVQEMRHWRDAETCPMTCPEGKIYKACGPDSQPSCALPSSSTAAVDNATCVEGCFCPDGLVLEGGKCIPKSECPCRLRNKIFKNGQVVNKDCNTCACEAGEWKCTQAPCGARCSAVGDPHYTSFDGLRYDFMGQCTYYLLKTDNLTIEVENVACSGAITEAMNLTPYKGSGKPSCTKSVNIKYKNANIHMKQGGFILVNGQELSTLPTAANDIRIRAASSLFVIVQLPNKVDVWWDGATRVFVDVPPEFHEKTKGLCGTFNLNQKDDFLTPEGDIEQSVYAFANKWKTRELCDDVDLKEPEHPCKANVENKDMAEKYCSKLKSKLFEPCHWYVDVEPYYESCLFDVCACAGDVSRCLCPALGDYATACARAQLSIQWRYNVKECELTCTGGQEYTVCADSCVRTCADVAYEGASACKPTCVEGCACKPAQVLNEENLCVPVGMCPCYHKGIKFEPGYKEVRAGRRERELCTCVGARWDCVPATPNDIQNYPPAEDMKSNCSAANHMEFTTCETAEPLTCKNMHLPPSSTTAECRPGCQCKKGYVLETVSKKCVLATECPCHHGGRSYPDSHVMQEDCNKCECKNGNWSCTSKRCAGVCAAWGDSHVSSFDGSEYDFEGVCTYLLAKGVLDGKDGFDVEIQNVPCGTTGATCSKSITLRVGTGNNEEIVSLTKGTRLPNLSKLKRIKMRIVGAYVFLDVPSLGMSVQWDRGMRVYVKVDAMWQGRVKGLCGNYNGDMRDDYQSPGGGIPESSALLFVDSWKLKTTCPKPQPVRDHCKQRPERKEWAMDTCGALKRYPFTLCHTEVGAGAFVERCERDACACDAGGDCACACAALAHYAHLCATRGVPFKWRTQELCPMQCDEECSNYDACLSSCPLETCDNTLDYPEIKAICEQDTCVEGCKPKKACDEGSVYTNNSFTECVARSKCRHVCLTLPDGKQVLEGQITEEDACHTCRCSKSHIVCTGQPCSTALPYVVTEAPTHKPNDEALKCATGWTPWINRGPPETGANGESLEKEPLPKPNELQIGQPMCTSDKMTQIECRTTVNHKSAKETGLDVECSLERGLVCKETGDLCPDFEIRVFCQCEDVKTDEPFQCLNSDHPNYPHPTNCSQFYECTPDELNPNKKHAVLKTCGGGLMYNPDTMVCDWPNSVIAVRPSCGATTPEEETIVTQSTQTTVTTSVPITTAGRCPVGTYYSECAYPCNQLCHYFKRVLLDKGRCLGFEKCVEGCIPEKCEKGWVWRDENSCVPPKDCTCYSDGKLVKPAQVAIDGCIKCQCLENDLHCDTSDCASSPEPRKLTTTTEKTTITTESTTTTTEATTIAVTTPLIVKNTATPPPECAPESYKNLLWEDEPLPPSAFEASSIANDLFAPQYAQLNAHPIDINAGSWSPAVEDDKQYIQVTFPRREPIYGVIMQGSPLFDQYVTSYEVMYGDDAHTFSVVEGPDGKPKVFRGPVDHTNPMKQMLDVPIEAKVVRIRPLSWHDSISVRLELIGCGQPSTTTVTTTVTTPEPIQCMDNLGLMAKLPIENIEVSSNNDLRSQLSMEFSRGWRPAYSTPGEWIMFDFTSPRNITGIKTRGGPSGWVSAYNIYYTSDLSTFNPVLDDTGAVKVFPGNFDKRSTVYNNFKPPIHARYLKVIPIKWKDAIEMRVEPIGCFEPYPVTEVVADTTPPYLGSCALCPGVRAATCQCDAPAHYSDGDSCVTRDQCPCVEGFMTYAVGSTFRGANCDECVCKLGGITICKPIKECQCAPDLVPKLVKSTCECACEPCPENTRICPTSKICLSLNKWCDGLQDCPDDEKDCRQKEEIVATTEPTVVTTVAMTVAVTAATVAVTTPKPEKCPDVSCPPGYFVRYVSTSSYSRSTSDLPPPRPRNSYSRYTKGGYRKGGFSKGGYSKGGYAKGGYAKGGYSKGGQTPSPISTTTFQATTPQPTNTSTKQECRQFKCIPNLPPPFKPGATPAPLVCSAPVCPPHYTLKMDTASLGKHQCPQYVCVPPPEKYAYCNMTGRTFNTFDGAEFKFDVCDHTLARDAKFRAWSVQVRKMCTVDGCLNQLILQQDDDTITIKPNLVIQYNQYEYTVEQTSKICFQKNSFDVNKVGNGLLIASRRYDFAVYYTTDGNVKVAVNTKYQEQVEGLCGYYDGDVTNERRKPDGSYATGIDEFAHSWAKAGLRPDACEIKIIPPEKQRKAWDLCDVVTKEPFSQCAKVLNLDKWRSICLEKICECAELITNGTKKTDEECRCEFLDTLVAQCLAADEKVDLGDWRMMMDCPADCPPPLMHYDCYRRSCEPTCTAIGTGGHICPPVPGECFPGCYCPPGKLRKGDSCVAPQDCLDCTCSGVGTPAKYVSFEGDDLPFLGNCTYLASRDRNDTGKHIYEVYATNGPCEGNSQSVCVKSVRLIYAKNVVHVTKDDVTGKLMTSVNDKPVFSTLSNDWLTIMFSGADVTLLLGDAHVEVKVFHSKMEFSVKVASYLYANQTEGLCGVCAGYEDFLITSNGTIAEDFEEYGKSWQATPETLDSLKIPPQASCGDITPPPPCRPPPPEHNPCYNLLNADRFGPCHALLDPHSYIESCEEELCERNSTDVCSVLERYAAECRRLHVCLDWRGGLCPYPCDSPFEYNSCMSCERTCENNEEIERTQKGCDQTPVEGCFCPPGKVRVNNTCIEPSKCFPCDAKKEHYAGDEWQEDACTKCRCSKLSAEHSAHVACTAVNCAPPPCAGDSELLTTAPRPGVCCPTYVCVPATKKAVCEEPKMMECGFGQVLKQKTGADGCPQFTCECKPASECEPLPNENDIELLEPGMERVIDNSSCCPRVLMLCKREHCPAPPDCPKYHELVTDSGTGKCCVQYTCEAPKNKCIVSLEWEATPKGGEKLKEKPQVVLKDLDSQWIDGPCRLCTCVNTPRGPSPRCSVTECAAVSSSEQLVLEPRPVPFACCPAARHVACRHQNNIYKPGENWTSTDNVCESYQCVRTDDDKLEIVTTVQQCNTDCEPGWEYVRAAGSSGQCCGRCRPVACVCEGVAHHIGHSWDSPDHCTHYVCLDTDGTIQVQSFNESCPEVPAEMKKQFVLKEETVPGKCCKTQEPIACRVGNDIYQEDQTWPTSDPCKNYTCGRDVTGRLTHKESIETCESNCARGWVYRVPKGACCGRCQQDSCVHQETVRKPGEIWHSEDNCTTYSCDRVGDSLSVTVSRLTCPDVSGCPPEDLVNDTCCPVCKEKPQALSTCVPTPLGLESVGAVRVQVVGRGLCVNTRPEPRFKECRGTCNSGTIYNNQTGSHDSMCECCQATRYEPVTVEVWCEDGSRREHRVASPAACACRACGGGPGTPWATESSDEIPEIYQRFGSTPPPRKHRSIIGLF